MWLVQPGGEVLREESVVSAETIRSRERPTTSDRHKANREAQCRTGARGHLGRKMKQLSSNNYASACKGG